MAVRQWHRGLYRRTALGYVAIVVVVLLIQALVMVWYLRVTAGTSDDVRQRSVAWTQGIGVDVARALEAKTGGMGIQARLHQLDFTNRVFVILRNGEHFGPVPAEVLEVVSTHFRRAAATDPLPVGWAEGMYAASPIIVGGRTVGVVGMVPATAWARMGPRVAAIGIGALLLAIAMFSVAVVAPVRARLISLQSAARRLAKGEFDARVRTDGDDEVSELASTFNHLASELEVRALALKRSDGLRRQLIADVSHELMTPVTAVLGHLETLDMEEVNLDRRARRRYIRIAIRETHRLRRVIGDLLSIAKAEAGGIQFEHQEIQTRSLFFALRGRHERACRVRRISFDVDVAADAAVFQGDPFRIEQAIENLVTNAIRHTPDDGRIMLAARRAEDEQIIEVANTGEGIPAEHLPHIFDRFYKASSAEGLASPGSGLGLSIVNAIVKIHCGRVTAASTPGVGTVFTIALPAAGARFVSENPPDDCDPGDRQAHDRGNIPDASSSEAVNAG